MIVASFLSFSFMLLFLPLSALARPTLSHPRHQTLPPSTVPSVSPSFRVVTQPGPINFPNSTATATTIPRRKGTRTPPSPSPPPIVLLTTLTGGLGNQIHCLLHALLLARRTGYPLLLPTFATRNLPSPNPQPPTPYFTADTLWNIQKLSAVAPIVTSMPSACQQSVHSYYHLVRPPAFPTPRSKAMLPSRAAMDICVASRRKERPDRVCAARALEGTRFHTRFLPHATKRDDGIVNEVTALAEEGRGLRRGEGNDDTKCVFIEGLSFNRVDNIAIQYLNSLHHFIQPSPRIERLVTRTMRMQNVKLRHLAVLHVRHDEYACRNAPKGKLCVRVNRTPAYNGTVFWASIPHVVNAVIRLLHRQRMRAVHLAMSPYVPQDSVRLLRVTFARRGVRVIRGLEAARGSVVGMAEEEGHDFENLVDREMAIGAAVFIGEIGSSWSKSVYYTRRTMKKKTWWSAALLKVHDRVPSENDPLPLPNWFERQSILGLQLGPRISSRIRYL